MKKRSVKVGSHTWFDARHPDLITRFWCGSTEIQITSAAMVGSGEYFARLVKPGLRTIVALKHDGLSLVDMAKSAVVAVAKDQLWREKPDWRAQDFAWVTRRPAWDPFVRTEKTPKKVPPKPKGGRFA